MNERSARTFLLAFIALAVLWTFPYLAPLNNPNENVRLYMTAAIVEHGTFAIGYRQKDARGRYQDRGSVYDRFGYVNDKAITCAAPEATGPECEGTLYAAKAPGTSYLGVPVYAALKGAYALRGAEPAKDAVLFWLRLTVVVLPTLLFLWAFAAHLERRVRAPFVRHALLLALGAGSLLFSYANTFAGHTPAAFLLGGAFLALARIEDSRQPLSWSALAGLLAAAAVMTEYPSALGAALLFLWLFARGGRWPRGRWRLTGAFVTGALPPAALLALYHHVCFGAPWRTAYSTLENTQFVADIAPGLLGVHLPNLEAFAGSFFAPYNGLFFFAPWTLLIVPALVSAWRRWRHRAPLGPELALHGAIFIVYALFISSHSLWRGGWTLGPRYIVMAMPFLALAVALAADGWAQRRPQLTGLLLGALGLVSVLIALAMNQVSQGFPPEYYSPLFEFAWPMLRDGFVYRNAGNLLGLRGLWSLAPLAAGLALAAALLLRSRVQARRPPALAILAGAALVLALLAGLSRSDWDDRKTGGLTWQRRIWPVADQSPQQRRLAELEQAAHRGPLSADQRAERARLSAAQGELDRAWRFVVPTRKTTSD